MTTRDDATKKTEAERVTRDSARTTAPQIRRPWLVRVVFIIVVLGIVTAVVFAVRMGVGGRSDAVSDPSPPASEAFPPVRPTSP